MESTAILVRFPTDVATAIRIRSERESKSINSLIVASVEEYLARRKGELPLDAALGAVRLAIAAHDADDRWLALDQLLDHIPRIGSIDMRLPKATGKTTGLVAPMTVVDSKGTIKPRRKLRKTSPPKR